MRRGAAPASLGSQQAAVISQALPMLALTALYFRWAPAYLAAAHPSLDECAPALLPLLLPRLLAVSALPLLAAVVLVGNARFLGRGINPLEEPLASSVLSRNLSNTLEQYVLHSAAVSGLAAWGRCSVAVAAAPWFVFARALFLWGYLVHPVWRGAGFAATAYPTAAALAYCAWRAATDGLLAGA